ncbi:HIT domain-containing protein [archaeon]|nr:HIT domain-containing protein [archaeon]
MTDTGLDLKNIKEKLIEQIKTQYDEQKANDFILKINEMNEEQFLEFLKKQGLIQGEENSNCIFCQMIAGNIPTTKIGENEKGIAILEINPISKGHTLIIPKEHLSKESDLPKEIEEIKEKIKSDLTQAFKPQRVDVFHGNLMGHEIINILPVYSVETMETERYSETPEGLKKIKEEIENSKPKEITLPEKPKEIEMEKSSEEIKEDAWIPKRMLP